MKRNQGKRLLLGAGMFGLSLLGLSSLQRVWQGSPRLISIQETPEIGDSCERPARTVSSPVAAPEQSLFTDFGATPVHAQDSGEQWMSLARRFVTSWIPPRSIARLELIYNATRYFCRTAIPGASGYLAGWIMQDPAIRPPNPGA